MAHKSVNVELGNSSLSLKSKKVGYCGSSLYIKEWALDVEK